jgi:hypothetical protein
MSSRARTRSSRSRWAERAIRCFVKRAYPRRGEPDGRLAVFPRNLDDWQAEFLAHNPPSNPTWRSFADSAVQTVTKCNPLQVPPRYQAHFEQWRKMTLYFSPNSAPE